MSKPIDIHAHYYPDTYLRMVAAEGGRYGTNCEWKPGELPVIDIGTVAMTIEQRYFDLAARLASMDRQEVAIHALSLTQPMVYWAPGRLAKRLSEIFNDACVEAHLAHPTRFVGLAMLPMNEPALAIAELSRIAGNPGICGIYMGTRIGDLELSDQSLFPVYEAIEDAGLTIFLHPIKVVDPQRLRTFYLTNLIGNPTETVIAASHLIFGEVLDRFPNLTFCLPHAGGSLPYLIGRITHGWGVRPECRHLKSSPDSYLRRFYYDTISHSHAALDYLISLVGADRVVMGSDFCFDMSCRRPVEFVDACPKLTDAEKSLILADNARRLLAI